MPTTLGEHAVAELDVGVRAELGRQAPVLVAVGPVRAAQPRAGHADGRAGEDDQHQRAHGDGRHEEVLLRGEGDAFEAAHAATILTIRRRGAAEWLPSWLRDDRAGDRRRGREQELPPPTGADAHAQGAGAAPVPAHRRSTSSRAVRDVSFDGRARRVLRDRRAQRLGQEHAAEVPRRASTRADSGEIYDRRPAVDRSSSSASASTRTWRRATTCSSTAIMLGLTPREARERFDEVIEFAELEEFADLKLKNYSSGMQVRLAFSVMIQVDADVLLIDEVLAVGDAAFQQKCFDEFNRLRDEGRTILFVTHDMGAVRALLPPRDAARARRAASRSATPSGSRAELPRAQLRPRPTAGGRRPARRPRRALRRRRGARSSTAWFEDDDGERADDAAPGRHVQRLRAGALPRARSSDPRDRRAAARTTATTRCSRPRSECDRGAHGRLRGRRARSRSRSRFENWLAPGPLLRVARGSSTRGGARRDWTGARGSRSAVVHRDAHARARLVDLPHDIAIERGERRMRREAHG